MNIFNQRKPIKHGILPMSAAVLLLVITLAGCGKGGAQSSQAPMAPEVDVAPVISESVTLHDTFTGRIESPESVELRPRVTGYIQDVAFTEGEMVNAGDLLFQIDPRPYQARVKAAEAQLRQATSQQSLAEKEAKRAKNLLKNQAISEEEYDQRQAAFTGAEAGADAAAAALETAKLDLEYTRVIAPVSGRAGRAFITRGNLARADDTLLTTVESVDPLYVYFDSNESTALDSQSELANESGVTLAIEVSGENNFPRSGELDYVSNRLDANTGTLQMRAVLDNPGGALRPGQFARVQMPITQLDKALLVRRSAVLTNQDRRYVYLVEDNNTVSQRQVETGREVDGLLVIHKGLAAGDRVVVSGTQKIFAPGMQVAPQQVAMRVTANISAEAVATREP